MESDSAQMVDHVHFHVIPKDETKGDEAGLVVGWPVSILHIDATTILTFTAQKDVRECAVLGAIC